MEFCDLGYDNKDINVVYERLLYHKTFSDDDIKVLKRFENAGHIPYELLNTNLRKRVEDFVAKRTTYKHINDGHIKSLPSYLKICLCADCGCQATDIEFSEYLPPVTLKGIKVEDSSGESVIYEGENLNCLEAKLLSSGYKFIRNDGKCLIYFKG